MKIDRKGSSILDYREDCPLRMHAKKVRYLVRRMRHKANAVVGLEDMESAGFAGVWKAIQQGRGNDDLHVFAMASYYIRNSFKPARMIPDATYYRMLQRGEDPRSIEPSVRRFGDDGDSREEQNIVDEYTTSDREDLLAPFRKSTWYRPGYGRNGTPPHVRDAIAAGIAAGMTKTEIAFALGMNAKSLTRVCQRIDRDINPPCT